MRFFRIRSFRVLAGAVLLAGLAAAGCGSKSAATITGEVKYNGQPLPSGMVTFMEVSGNHKVAGSDITNGKYTITNFPPGPVKILVVTLPPAQGGSPPNGKPIPSPTTAPAGAYVPIPPEYASAERTTLNYTVTSGQQTHNIDLK